MLMSLFCASAPNPHIAICGLNDQSKWFTPHIQREFSSDVLLISDQAECDSLCNCFAAIFDVQFLIDIVCMAFDGRR